MERVVSFLCVVILITRPVTDIAAKLADTDEQGVTNIAVINEDSLGSEIGYLKAQMGEIVRALRVQNDHGKSDVIADKTGNQLNDRRRREVYSSTTAPESEHDNPPTGLYPICPAGKEGPPGPPGPQGVPGRDGRDGRDVMTRMQDICGIELPKPSESPSHPTSQNLSGVAYIRWGNSECADGSERVYAGTMAGAYYSNTGGGSNPLCMPPDPIYDEYEPSTAGERARIYSAEYQTDVSGSLPARLRNKQDHTPTCAVCRAPPGRTTKMMIPARNVCPSSAWRLEYAGYLMSNRHNLQKSEFICMDRQMEEQPATTGNQEGALFYLTEAICLVGGGLPCGPYINGYELTCAVCTI